MSDKSKVFIVVGADGTDPETGDPVVRYWNVDLGWQHHLADASMFDPGDKTEATLPVGGVWLDITADLVR